MGITFRVGYALFSNALVDIDIEVRK